MKKYQFILAFIFCSMLVHGQTVYVPSGAAGIATSTNSNVGIGTDSPDTKLDISLPGGSTGASSGLRIRAGNNNTYFGNTQVVFSFNQTLNYSHALKTRHDSGNMPGNSIDFYVWKPGDAIGSIGSNHVMSLNGGKVGIGGITSPSQPLDINTTSTQGIQLQHNNNKWVRFYSPSLLTDSYNNISVAGDAGIIFGYGNANDVDFGFTIAPWSNTGVGGFRMTASGNIGIGTPSPASLLHVVGENPETRIQATASNKFAALHVMNDLGAAGVTLASYGSAYAPNAIYERANGASVHTTSTAAGAAGLAIVAKNPTGYLTFHTGGPTEKMRISANGNVGIGSAGPMAKLQIYNAQIFNQEMTSAGQDHILLNGVDPGNGGYFGGLTWESGGRRRASIAATREASDPDFVGLAFFTKGTDGVGPISESMRIDRDGNVGIGTINPDQKLTVKGIIHTEEVRVDMTVPGPDYVFAPDYNLLPLTEVESFIKTNKHLPEVPSAKQMEEEGLNLKEMNLLLLKKVEELTLHLIEIKKENIEQQKEINLLKNK